MNPKVRDLYKRLVFIGRYQYPFDNFPVIKQRFRDEIFKNRDVTIDSVEFKRLIAFGRYQLRELQTVGQVHKYRTLKKRYGSEDES